MTTGPPHAVAPAFVTQIAQRVAAAAAADEVLLFGSFVKGRQQVHSDIDLVVVLMVPPSPTIQMAAEDAARGHTLKVDLVIRERTALQAEVAAEPLGFLDAALRHAISVFRRPEVASVLP